MKFEVINDNNKVVMSTTATSCIPDKDAIDSMSKERYKFRLDGKIIIIKKLNEKLKEINNEQDNQD